MADRQFIGIRSNLQNREQFTDMSRSIGSHTQGHTTPQRIAGTSGAYPSNGSSGSLLRPTAITALTVAMLRDTRRSYGHSHQANS